MKIKISFFLLTLWCTFPCMAKGASLWEKATTSSITEESNIDSIMQEEMFEVPQETGEFSHTAEIVILDRRLGKVSKPFIVSSGTITNYADISFTLKKCWHNKEEHWNRDARALLEIKQPSESNAWIFSRYSFLSQFKNERYDILLKQCK